jgi:hypothetical protein
VSSRQDIISVLFTKLEKTKAVKLMGGDLVYVFVCMNGFNGMKQRERQESASWDGHAIQKCKGM